MNGNSIDDSVGSTDVLSGWISLEAAFSRWSLNKRAGNDVE
jgi:hypothetical protein